MKHRMIAAGLICALAAAPTVAHQANPAQGAADTSPARSMPGSGPMGGGMGMLRMADANGDGTVTRAEYAAAVDRRFDRMDANHDGVLSADEMPMRGAGGRGRMGADAPPAPPAPSMPTRPPVTRDRYRTGAMRRFDRLDANHDGRIDQAEMTAAEARRPGRGGGMGEAPPGADR